MSSTCTTTTTCCSSAVKTAPLLHGYASATHIHAATVQSSVAHWLYAQLLQDPAHPSSAVALLNDNALDLTSEQLPSVLAGAHVVENDKPLGAVTGGTLGPVLVAFTTRGVGMVWDLRAVVRHVPCAPGGASTAHLHYVLPSFISSGESPSCTPGYSSRSAPAATAAPVCSRSWLCGHHPRCCHGHSHGDDASASCH